MVLFLAEGKKMDTSIQMSDIISCLALICSTLGIFLNLLTLREMQKQRLLSIKPKLILKLKDDQYNYFDNPSYEEIYGNLNFILRNIGSGGAWNIEIISKINASFIPKNKLISIYDNAFATILVGENSLEGFRIDIDDDATYDVLTSGEELLFSFEEITGLVYTVISILLKEGEYDDLYNLEDKELFTFYIYYSDIIGKRHCDIYSLRIKVVRINEGKKSADISYTMVSKKNKFNSLFIKKATKQQAFQYIKEELEILSNLQDEQK